MRVAWLVVALISLLVSVAGATTLYESGNTAYPSGNVRNTTAHWSNVWTTPLTSVTPLSNNIETTVLASAGSRPAQRDAVDARIINDVITRTRSARSGYPTYVTTSRTFDLPSNPNADDDGDGYTNIEEALHVAAASVE
jgi:hypothetical protein